MSDLSELADLSSVPKEVQDDPAPPERNDVLVRPSQLAHLPHPWELARLGILTEELARMGFPRSTDAEPAPVPSTAEAERPVREEGNRETRAVSRRLAVPKGSGPVGDLSQLADLGAVPEENQDDPAPPERSEPLVKAFVPPTVVRIAPVPRGIVEPVMGHMSDPGILRALRISGDGWLNCDGRIVANGTYCTHEAIRAVGGMGEAFARIARLEEASLQRARRIHAASRAAHIASGDPEEEFFFDWNLYDEYTPEMDPETVIAAAGWARIELRRDNGVKTIFFLGQHSESSGHMEQIEALLTALGFEGRPLPPPPPTLAELRRRAGIEDEPEPSFRL